MAYDIITVGSATLDVFAQTNIKSVRVRHGKTSEPMVAYPLGSKILIDELHFEIGGGGTNTAVAFSRLGLKTAYLGSIGEDLNGKRVLELLKKEKISFIGTECDTITNYSVILDTASNDRTILVYKGASEKFKFEKIGKSKLKTRWFYLCAMINNGFKELEKIAIYAKENNIKVAFNPSSYLATKGSRYLKKIIGLTDVLILNNEEACMIVGKKGKKKLAESLIKLGAKNIVITDGKNKILTSFDNNIKEYTPHKIKPKETTGAGDAFGSTFISGLIMKNDVDFAIGLALKNSESVIKHIGAKNGLLTKKEII
jgi:ribokinase